MADYERLYLQEKQANQKLIEIIKDLQAKNQKLIESAQQLAKLAKAEQQKALEAKMSKLIDINFNDFCDYLTLKFKVDSMPKASGIYAYINQSKQYIYVGQSKNMGNRLRQHFRNGKIKINGHDCEFKSEDDWDFYVLEYIDKNNKKLLDEREAYWISLAKLATSDKTIINSKETNEYLNQIYKDPYQLHKPAEFAKTIPTDGQVINKTRGNNVKM